MTEKILKNIHFRLIYEISTIVNSSIDIAEILNRVINVLTEVTGVKRSTITLLNKDKQSVSIIAAHDLTVEAKQKGSYKLGEGITGKVAKTGKPMLVPSISKEPMFLNKTKARGDKEDVAFICVPIKFKEKVIGTFSLDRLFEKNIALENDLELLTVITSIIAEKINSLESIQNEKRKLLLENTFLKNELKRNYSFANFIGKSSKMQEVYEQIQQVSGTNTTVMIRGESGTGKELVAHAIHHNSLRSGKPFIKVNCSALPEDLIESELFGHEKGSFTDAYQQKIGRFELASGGTIFLDEIGELTPALQIKLLRVLQEKEFERVGGTKTIKVNVRVITATNRDLELALKERNIREDFYYRINVFSIFIPPLRNRKSDILLLADYFTEKYANENNKKISRISTPAIDMLMSYHWPGNVRELENCIERSVIVSSDGVIHGHNLPPSLQLGEEIDRFSDNNISFELAVNSYEKELIVEVLKKTNGNKLKAAQLLMMTNRIIGYKIERLGIDPNKYKVGKS